MSNKAKSVAFLVALPLVMIVYPMWREGLLVDPNMQKLAAVGVCVGLFGGLAFFGLFLALLIVTASPKVREDAETARKMGLEGVGTRLHRL